MKLLPACLIAALALSGQTARKADDGAEQRHLRGLLSEAGNSPLEFIRALEKHLKKYPETAEKPELERALVRAAIDARDERRIVLYGQRVLAREPDDAMVLERVTRALLRADDEATAQKALAYARKFEEVMRAIEKQEPPERRNRGQMVEEMGRALGKALVYQARATGNLKRYEEAVALARRGYETYPSAESAREIGRWLARAGRDQEALQAYADAFTIEDEHNTAGDRAQDRARLGELWRKLKGSEAGLGDVVLAAYDRTAEVMARRLALQRQADPNAQRTDLMDFTLTGLDGDKLALASLKGKVVVLDFWATWCGPCRAQYPLYEEVKKRFARNADVVFLAINTDEDHSLVKPFLAANGWKNKVYFEGGLSELLRVSSIPTTILVGRGGKVINRLNGFLPDRFVEMLTERIHEAPSAQP
ncbi:MAG: redoxin family protein [Acidobacteria bacterium]|nr:redoxin family protein [Acidobacteriota bacterium]MBI3280153.1 redoxin family protein [Acidobacteriota bacterium]